MPLDVTTKLIVTAELVAQITQPSILAKHVARLPHGADSVYPCCEARSSFFRLSFSCVKVVA
jgi:hypothetical protein